jgi:hypothetical protein
MTAEFIVKLPRKTIESLPGLLKDWAEDFQKRRRIPLLVTPLAEESKYTLFTKGSIRGVVLTPSSSLLRGTQLEVRLYVMASAEDWSMAYALMQHLVEKYEGVVSETGGGGRQGYASLSEVSALQRAEQTSQPDFDVLKRMLVDGDEPFIKLPNAWFDLTVTQEEFKPFTQPGANKMALVVDRLKARAARLGLCQQANVRLTKDGTRVSIIVTEPAIYTQTDFAAITEENLFDKDVVRRIHYLRFEELVDFMGVRMEKVKEDPPLYYLPAFNLDQVEDLILYRRLYEDGLDYLPAKAAR